MAKAVKAKKTPRKSQDELESLKDQWLNDPCWDIEETEGFEAHRQELYVFRLENELQWLRRRYQQLRRTTGDFVAAFSNLKDILKA